MVMPREQARKNLIDNYASFAASTAEALFRSHLMEVMAERDALAEQVVRLSTERDWFLGKLSACGYDGLREAIDAAVAKHRENKS